jgi:hypothetical protein
MLKEFKARVQYLFKPSESWNIGYQEGYRKGLKEGQDFGERIAHNRTLSRELPKVLTRYSQLQVKIINKPKAQMRQEIQAFTELELNKLKMEMQDR